MKYNSKSNFSVSSFYKNLELIIYLSIGFVAPIFIGHPQLVVGTIVNTILATSAFRNVNKTKAIALAVAPSLGAVMHGILFGNLTNFVLYFLPAIWISNFTYMAIIKWTNNKNKSSKFKINNNNLFIRFIKKISQTNHLGAIFSASVIKTSILFGTAALLVSINLVPKIFLITMSGMQILTALTGGGVAIGIVYLLNKTSKQIKA